MGGAWERLIRSSCKVWAAHLVGRGSLHLNNRSWSNAQLQTADTDNFRSVKWRTLNPKLFTFTEGLCTDASRSIFESRLEWTTSVGSDTVRSRPILAKMATWVLAYHFTASEVDCTTKQLRSRRHGAPGWRQSAKESLVAKSHQRCTPWHELVRQVTLKTSTGQLLRISAIKRILYSNGNVYIFVFFRVFVFFSLYYDAC